MNNHRNCLSSLCLMLLLTVLLVPRVGAAEQAFETSPILATKGLFGIGVGLVRFDTNVKFTDKQGGRPPIFVDAEGSLGLPDTDAIPTIYAGYQFAKKHAVGFSYFQVQRESTLFVFDQDLGGINVTGDLTVSDETRFYNIFYLYNLFADDRSGVNLIAGLNSLDIKYALEANGEITIRGQTFTGTQREEVSVFAPLPLLGFDFWYAFTPRWGITTKIKLVGGRYQDVQAWVVNTTINTRYQFNRHVGGVLGITYFDADVVVDDSAQRTDVNYGYDGLFLGLHFSF